MASGARALPGEIERIFASGGEAGSLMRETDWAATAVGEPSQWPQSLRTAVSICLSSRFPMLIWWGSDLVNIYNDALTPIIGGKHPLAMGQRGQDCWPEIWDTIFPMLAGVLGGGGATYVEDQMLPLERYGFSEECYFTFAYSPIRDEAGDVGGVFTAAMETTGRVVGERRLRTLRAIASRTAQQQTAVGVLQAAAEVLENDAADVPFALLFSVPGDDSGKQEATLVAACGPGVDIAAVRDDPALLAAAGKALMTHELQIVDDLDVPAGELIVRQAVALPVEATGATAVVVAGVSPRRPLDDDYSAFFALLEGQLATGLGQAVAYESERARAEALAEIDRAKTTFFSNVSHEFRTPLTLMLGPLEDALEDAAQPLDAPHRERLEMAHRNALRLLRLVNTLLDFSRLEAGRISAVYEPVDLAGFTADLASMFRAAVEKAGLVLEVRCDRLPQPVFVDRQMWENIVGNLLSNALKFTFAGQIAVSLEVVDAGVRLTVSDTGTGVAEEDRKHLFERFRQVQGAQARSHEGSGIGLALVAELTALHGGSVDVESTPGVGSRFSVTLPFGSAHLPAEKVTTTPDGDPAPSGRAVAFVEETLRWVDEPSDAEHPVSQRDVVGSRDGRVLVVDDNADMRAYLTALLGRSYQVDVARNGEEALELVRRDPPDLVLTDVMMPVMDGTALLRTVRQDPDLAHLPIIMLSARAGEAEAVEGLSTGADDYLVKPFAASELLARVRANLELARARRSRGEMERRQLLLDQAQQLSRVGSWEIDLATGAINGSREFLRQMQMSAEELQSVGLEAGIASRVHPDDVQHVRDSIAASLEGAPLDYVTRVLTPDGQERIYRVLGLLERDDEGRPIRLQGSNQDITEQRRAEQAMAAAAAAQEAAVREHRIADELQRSLLPPPAFTSDHLRVATYYRAGMEGSRVGGDWYDVIELGAGRTALVIGDVMGRGVRAAAVMGQLRAVLRAYARLDLPPAEVLENLDGFVRDIGEDQIVTCVYAVYDPGDRSFTYATAGHLPPLLLLPGQAARPLTAAGPPLGIGFPGPVEERVELPVGATVALYTDGLVERRNRDLDHGIDRLAALLSENGAAIEETPESLVRSLLAGEADDDVAILLAQVLDDSRPRLTAVRQIPPYGSAVRHARDFTLSTMRSWGMPDELTTVAVLLTSELITNAIVHGRPPIELRLQHGPTDVVIEAHDSAAPLPRRLRMTAEDEYGRGLQLVAQLADRWGTRPTPEGKAVWCRLEMPSRDGQDGFTAGRLTTPLGTENVADSGVS